MIIQECILTAIRESIPTEDIIKAYMDESVELEEEVVVENIEEPVLSADKEEDKDGNTEGNTEEKPKEDEVPSVVPSIKNLDDSPVITRLTFNDYDSVLDSENKEEKINAPKSIERLEEISTERAIQRKLEEDDDLDDKIKIHTDNISLDTLDIFDMDRMSGSDEFVSLDDIEELN
jgi:hypothetical protein